MKKAIIKIKSFIRDVLNTGLIHIMGAGALNKILTFVSSIFVVHLIDKGDYGVYSYAQGIFTLLCTVNGVGMDSALIQLCSEHYSNSSLKNRIYYWGCKVYLLSSMVVAIGVGICSIMMSFKFESTNSLLLLMTGLPILDGIKALQLAKCRVELDNKNFANLNNLDTVVLVVGTVVCASIFKVYGIILARYISSLACIFWALKKYHLVIVCRIGKVEKAIRKEVINIGLIMTLNNSLANILSVAGTLILAFFIPDEELIASYRVASTIPLAMLFIPQYLMIYYTPLFAREKDNAQWIRSQYKSLMIRFGGGNLILCFVLILFAYPLISIVFGNNYSDAVSVFRIMIVAYLIQSIFRIPSANLLTTQKKLWINVFMSALGALINIVFNCILIPRYGSEGAAYSYLLSFVIPGTVLTLVWIRTVYQK